MTITFLAPDGVAITAQQERQAKAALYAPGRGRRLGGRSGFRVDTPDTVLSATSTTWTLGPCAAMIDPEATTHQGFYGWANDANVTGTVTAADATNPRKDIVYIQINDSSAGDGSGEKTANVKYLAGTPAVSPSAPALPARSFLVGTITVPVAGGGSPTVEVNKAKFVAAGGVLPVFSVIDRANISNPVVGQEIQRMDLPQLSPTGIREKWNGTNWDHFGHTEFTAGPNTAGPNAAWGMGNFIRDTARSTDSLFVTANSLDTLRIRDAGLYSATLLLSFTKPLSGISWASIDGSYTTPLAGGLQNFVVPLPNVMLAAGQILNPILAHGGGDDGTGSVNRTFTSRIRITRIA